MTDLYYTMSCGYLIPSGTETNNYTQGIKPGEIVKMRVVTPRKTRKSRLNRLSHLMYHQAAAQAHSSAEDEKAYCKLRFGIPTLTDPRWDDWEETKDYYDKLLDGLTWPEKMERMKEKHRFCTPVTRLMTDDQIWVYINTCVQHYASEQNIVVLPASDADELRCLGLKDVDMVPSLR